jgi:LysR family transcriptional regulator, hydrogen peroxide-inducible genes activator
MTLQQLEYVVALDNHRRFSVAAEECHVAQPSLSAALQKLEDELGVKLFDRSKQPVVPTELGVPFIQQARRVLRETEALRLMVSDHCEAQSGEFSLGIIPTLAPYLLPLFLKDFSEKFPEIKLHLHERTTENLLSLLKREQLDAILLATPVEEDTFVKDCLFYEEFVAYAPHEASILEKRFLLTEDIDPNRLVLLEEGHCMRNQVVNLCALQKAQSGWSNIAYEAGSLETLRRLVENHSGITILPQLAVFDLDEDQMQYVRFFQAPAPVREISLLTHPHFAKRRLLAALRESIMGNLPGFLKEEKARRVLEIG